MNSHNIWKYCYWLNSSLLSGLKKEIQERGIHIAEARQNPCEAMLGEIGYAEPYTWTSICKYDAAPWYNKSVFKDKILVVSSFPLDREYEKCLETTITPVSFDPSGMPTEEEKEELLRDAVFQDRKPPEWDKFPREMGEQITLGISKMTGKPKVSWDALFQTWTAVHSNFVSPRYRADESYMKAPYSIGDSFTISSCCVELFNLLESREKALLVRPCTGAALIKALEKDQYYFVRIVKNETSKFR